MDRATDHIEEHLGDEREALRSNLAELEDRVRSTLDWRRQFRGNTAAFLALALGGGLLLGMMTARRTVVLAEPDYPIRARAPAARYSDHRRRELSLAWRSIESALIGVAAAKIKNALANRLPGFREHLGGGGGDGYERGGYERSGSTRYRR